MARKRASDMKRCLIRFSDNLLMLLAVSGVEWLLSYALTIGGVRLRNGDSDLLVRQYLRDPYWT